MTISHKLLHLLRLLVILKNIYLSTLRKMNNSFINKYKSAIWFNNSYAMLSDSLIYTANAYICKPILQAF